MKQVIGGVVVLAIIIILALVIGKGDRADRQMNNGEQGNVEDVADMNEENEDEEMEVAEEIVMEPGVYIDYSPEAVAGLEDKRGVIFFSASWCPSCKAADKDILANEADIPSDVVIMKADFDALGDWGKSTYGISGQHAFVQVNSDGEKIRNWSGGNLAKIVRSLK